MFQSTTPLRGTRARFATLVVLCTFGLAVAPAAHAELVPPILQLGPITVANGTATVTGNVGGQPTASVNLAVNGQPIGVNAGGSFAGTIDLAGQSVLAVTLKNPLIGETYTISIPLNSNLIGPGGVIPPTVLSLLESAGISLQRPPEGFKILDFLPLKIEGGIANKDALASLKINGTDVLGNTQPSGGGGGGATYSQTLPGSTKEVTVTATDKQGVSQTSTFGVLHASSVIRTEAGRSVSAAGALGLRIASVRYTIKRVKQTKRVTAVVTIKDTRGFLVRGAIVRLRPAAHQHRNVVGPQQVKLTNKLGRASFTFKLRTRAFGKRLFTVAVAASPTRTVKRTTSVRLPRLKPAARR